MKISHKWLSQYIKTELTPESISEILTTIGLEVESFEKIEGVKGGLEGVVVGKVLTCEKHPDADKLSVTTIDLGDGTPTQIVCGAPNVAAGQKVLVATIGCTLYPKDEAEGFKIKKSKIRGVESLGMICAEDELGLGTSHDGIMVLNLAAIPGTPAKKHLEIKDDYLYEIGLTPNRIDAASHYGVARDLAAYIKSQKGTVELTIPSIEGIGPDDHSNEIKVEVIDSEACPRYMGLTITGVTIAPSPAWLQNLLITIGIAPRNNVVDITNYILHSMGQPLHAFDADKIEGKKVIVKKCAEGTPFVTLDGVERKLTANDLMICSAERPMCLAGVLGGADSGISETTKTIFLESAYFNPVTIRKSAKHHGLNTDASFRYERGCNPEGTSYALLRAAMLIKVIAGGKITSSITDIYPVKIHPFKVEVSFAHITKLIGKEIPKTNIKNILHALEIAITKETEEKLTLEVPTYRVDVQREADIIEEILRIYGYNNIEIPLHVNSTLTYSKHPDKDKTMNFVADFLSNNGFNEIMSNSLTKNSYYDNNAVYIAEKCVKIVNPLSLDLNVMRQTLLYNALEAAQLNTNRRNGDIKIYEFGNCYFYDASKANEGGVLPYSEEYHLSMLVTGADKNLSWNSKPSRSDFFTLKSVVEKLFKRLGLDIYEAQTSEFNSPIYREGIKYTLRNKELMEVGILNKNLAKDFDLKNDVIYLEMNFNNLLKLIKNNKVRVKELAKYPEVKRDLALLVDKNVSFATLRQIAFATEKKLLKKITLFDVYEGEKLPEGKKSYALGFVLQDSEATMTDTLTEKVMERLVAQFEKQASAQVRAQ